MKYFNALAVYLAGAGVALFITTIVIAHLVAPASYSFTQNTVSDLGAQGYAKAGIMRFGFFSFGLIICAAMAASIQRRKDYLIPDIALFFYGLGIFLVGTFSTTPFEPGISYSEREASLHSFFATAAGLMISLSMVSHIFADTGNKRKLFHTLAAVFVIGMSALFGLAESGNIPMGKGLVQKTMYIGGLGWIALNYCNLRLRGGQGSKFPRR
jgi:hypothetical membrane protein